MSSGDPVLDELKKISKILTLAHGASIEKELSKVVRSNNQKKMWVLIDGEKTSKVIAQEVGVTVRAVDNFLASAKQAVWVDNPWGKPPRRIIDYVPPSWIDLFKIPEEAEEKEKGQND